MNIKEIYPRFTLIDAHNRTLRYARVGQKFYREWLNPTPDLVRRYRKREITRSAYAYALLAKIEQVTTGKIPDPVVIVETQDNAEPSALDKFFGPKRTP